MNKLFLQKRNYQSVAVIFSFSFPAVVLGILLLVSNSYKATASPVALPNEYYGIWKGQGSQVNPTANWTVLFGLTGGQAGTVVGTTAYPSLRCGGELTLSNVISNSIILLENITYGAGATSGTCIDNGTITVTLSSSSTMHFEWRFSPNPSYAPGSANLTKLSGAGSDVLGSFVGVWRGQGTQIDPPAGSWTILFGIGNGSVGSVVGTTAYPSLRCGGELSLRSVMTDSIQLLEDITYGSCVDQGIITLTLTSPNAVDYVYRETDTDPTPSIGALNRVANSERSYVGVWKGVIDQTLPPVSPYIGTLTLFDGPVGSTIGVSAYLELRCGGELRLLSRSAITIEVQERLTYGTSSCITGVRKTLTPTLNSTLKYKISPNQSAAATGTLNRLSSLSNTIDSRYINYWSGVVQPTGNYSAVIVLTGGEANHIVGTIVYPELRCGGELLLSHINAENIQLLANITYGNCINQGTVTLTPNTNNTLTYVWNKDGTTNSATLLSTQRYFIYLPSIANR